MKDIEFGFTVNELGELGYLCSDISVAKSVLGSIVEEIETHDLKAGQAFYPKDYPALKDMKKYSKLFSHVTFEVIPAIESPFTDFMAGKKCYRLYVAFSAKVKEAVPCLCPFYLKPVLQILKVHTGSGC